MIDRVSMYYKAYSAHRSALRAAWAAYDKGIAGLREYRGSSGYSDDVKRLADIRDEAVKAARSAAAKDFDGILAGMRLSVDNLPLPETSEAQMNALALLKMREKPTRDELIQAARAVSDNPLTLGVVHEVAEKAGFRGLSGIIGGESIDSTRACIDRLSRAAREICALDKVDAMRERGIRAQRAVHETGSGIKELRGNVVDKDFNDAASAVKYFGGVGDVRSFSNFVNTEPFLKNA